MAQLYQGKKEKVQAVRPIVPPLTTRDQIQFQQYQTNIGVKQTNRPTVSQLPIRGPPQSQQPIRGQQPFRNQFKFQNPTRNQFLFRPSSNGQFQSQQALQNQYKNVQPINSQIKQAFTGFQSQTPILGPSIFQNKVQHLKENYFHNLELSKLKLF